MHATRRLRNVAEGLLRNVADSVSLRGPQATRDSSGGSLKKSFVNKCIYFFAFGHFQCCAQDLILELSDESFSTVTVRFSAHT